MELEDTTRRPSDQTTNITILCSNLRSIRTIGPSHTPLLIQDLWKKGMSWDEKLEPEEMRRCLELEKAFNQFDVIEVPRWTPQEYSEIHVFVDASEKALTRTILYVLRFLAKVSKEKIRNLKEFSKENSTSREYEKATQLLIKMAQSNITQKEIEHWGLRKDQNGNWRCVGRLRRTMPQIEDFPYFINKGKFAELIVKYYHEKLFHASAHYTWTKMRQRYWIPRGRAYIKKILRKICKGCAMWVVTPFEQPDFPPYPTARVTATRPFETVGVNLFGPIIIMENYAKTKRWVALFTCLATRAVHLEVMETMSTQQCVQAFRRFIG
uniref:Integrase_H2C2 domain-containing protein n=1 Tax=Onchocerca volvulus TaxID=6282 RepID=A0A8R1TUW2_ONCVO